jgi:nucleotide-binding universal stress UspA family protein
MKILLAVDGSSFSDAAIDEVASRPWPALSEVKVVSAFQVPMTTTPEVWVVADEYFPSLERIAHEQAQRVVDAAMTRLTNLDKAVTVSGEVLAGLPRDAILDEADRWKADLIVVGSHGYGIWHRFLLGSVSQAIVSHANCSVEVVHSRRENDAKAA